MFRPFAFPVSLPVCVVIKTPRQHFAPTIIPVLLRKNVIDFLCVKSFPSERRHDTNQARSNLGETL